MKLAEVTITGAPIQFRDRALGAAVAPMLKDSGIAGGSGHTECRRGGRMKAKAYSKSFPRAMAATSPRK